MSSTKWRFFQTAMRRNLLPVPMVSEWRCSAWKWPKQKKKRLLVFSQRLRICLPMHSFFIRGKLGIWMKLLPLFFLYLFIYCYLLQVFWRHRFCETKTRVRVQISPHHTMLRTAKRLFFFVVVLMGCLFFCRFFLECSLCTLKTPSGTTIAGPFHPLQSWKWNLCEKMQASVTKCSCVTFLWDSFHHASSSAV